MASNSFSSTATTVFVEDFRLEAHIGHQAPERGQPQVISVSIACTLANPDVPDDDLEHTFDYVPLIAEIQAFALARERCLIETFAEEIAAACFAHPRVETATISVRKPNKFPAVEAVGTTRTFKRST